MVNIAGISCVSEEETGYNRAEVIRRMGVNGSRLYKTYGKLGYDYTWKWNEGYVLFCRL